MATKESIETQDGKIVRMNAVAYRMAQKHFGARKLRQGIAKEKPIELLKINKPIVIAPPPLGEIPPVKLPEEPKQEAPVVEKVAPKAKKSAPKRAKK